MSREPKPKRYTQAVGIATKRGGKNPKNPRYPSLSTGSFFEPCDGARGSKKKKEKKRKKALPVHSPLGKSQSESLPVPCAIFTPTARLKKSSQR